MTRGSYRAPIPPGWTLTRERTHPDGRPRVQVYVLTEPDGTRHEFDRRRTADQYLLEEVNWCPNTS